MIVVDASAVIALLTKEAGHDEISSILIERADVLAPANIDVEVAGHIKRMERRGDLDSTLAARLLEDFVDLVGETVSLRGLLPIAWSLRHNLSIADAFYVGLASVCSAPLLTRDRRLAVAAPDGLEVLLI